MKNHLEVFITIWALLFIVLLGVIGIIAIDFNQVQYVILLYYSIEAIMARAIFNYVFCMDNILVNLQYLSLINVTKTKLSMLLK